MNRFGVSVLVVVFLVVADGAYGQVQRTVGGRSVNGTSTLLRTTEPESPGASSTVVSGPQAVVPRLMKFSGVLQDSTGKALKGTVDVTFSLYSTEAGGSPLWFETQTVQADEFGRYTALLGAMHTEGLPLDLFTSGEVRWLGIQVGLEVEQQPRVLLVSVPYALKAGDAETLGGKPASAYMLTESQGGTGPAVSTSTATSGTTQTGTSGKSSKTRTANTTALTPCTSVTSDGTAIGNSIALFTTACNVQSSGIYQANGNVGIGTTNPQALLHVQEGSIRLGRGGSYPAFLDQSIGSIFTITNGVGKKVAIDYNGFLGLGTTAPQAMLHVQDGSIRLQRGGSYGAFLDQSLGSIFTITNGGNKKLAFDSNGNLGVGTTAPGAKLEVNGTSKFDGVATFAAGANVTGTVAATLFSGSGAGLTGVPASVLAGGITVGGAGTGGISVGLNATSPDIVNGFSGNSVSVSVVGATISGGGASTLANSVSLNYGTIAGGLGNSTSGTAATIGGGQQNIASGAYSMVGGGSFNTASGSFATVVGGGTSNSASGDYSTVPGGRSNSAAATNSFAAGAGAQANHQGTFVWADYTGSVVNFASTAAGQFLIRASGGVGIGTNAPKATLDTAGQDRRKPVAFATLTACSSTIEGETAAVTDSTTNAWGGTVTGGGTNHVLAYCDGTNWTVAAK